ncbi:E3 ubiquitin-protein ligase ZNF598 [Halyomorpha halys]|uniref:E3 ubiquitin-protein ligase ZNF598 n=1 Tax=Halyomorpha halys TaxID=286706 RepID=UPI0006D4FF3A|nr:E3 ubiquitin-protein ligase ZNF598 [Halyomorpha halys]
MATKQSEEPQENTCVVCFKGVDIYSVGQCDHPVCYECSTRMRVLCRQNECPICRQDMPKVIFTKVISPYNSLKNINGVIDKKFKIVFETENEKNAYDALLAHECPKCSKVFVSFVYLRDHVRRVHQLNYCDLCVDNLKIYSRERKCYTRVELSRHRKEGDPDNRSHRGHPLCEFCDTRYMDNDELYRHLRRDHLFCHFCDADGLHQYYSSYDFLRDHFRSEHYLCEEGDCFNEKFTAVFRSEIDLKAHKASTHGKELGKAGLKQARTLKLELTLTPRPRPLHARPPRHREEVVDIPESVGAVGGTLEEETARKAPELKREEDFPALGSDSASASVSLKVTSAKQPSLSIQVNHPRFTTTVTSQNNYNYHFPALDNNSGGEVAATSVSWSGGSTGSGRRPVDQKANGNRPPPEDFPSLSAPMKSSVPRISTGVGTQSEPSEPVPHNHQPQQPFKTKKKKSKSGKGGTESKTKPVPSSSQSSVNGESKSKKNKKDVKSTPRIESSSLINNNIDNINNNHSKSENILKTLSIVPENVSAVEIKEKRNDGLPSGALEDFPSLSAPPGFPAMPPAAAAPRWEVKKPPKPPPGLGKPPPGLPPPGFSGYGCGNTNVNDTFLVILSRKMDTYLRVLFNAPSEKRNDGLPSGALEDFPSLSAPPGFPAMPPAAAAPRWEVKKPPKPPPGLGKPPPGLPPPGFSGLNGGFPPLIGGPAGEDTAVGGYITPSNFAKRNSSLVKLINSSLVGETLDEFKQISVAFRNGSLAAPEYYAHCREMLGPANFKELFPELLALLPDISKQQELWKVYKVDIKNTGTTSSKKKGNKLEACVTCDQIVRSSDLREHLAKHSGVSNHIPQDQGNAWSKVN